MLKRLIACVYRDRYLPRGDNTVNEVQRSAAAQRDIQGRISKTGSVRCLALIVILFSLLSFIVLVYYYSAAD